MVHLVSSIFYLPSSIFYLLSISIFCLLSSIFYLLPLSSFFFLLQVSYPTTGRHECCVCNTHVMCVFVCSTSTVSKYIHTSMHVLAVYFFNYSHSHSQNKPFLN